MNPARPSTADEIDLRELAVALLRRKWLILGLTLAAAAAAFVISRLIPKQYVAATQILFLDRGPVEFQELEARAPGKTLNAKSLTELARGLATTADLCAEVRATASHGGAIPAEFTVSLAGKRQLTLTATAPQPEQAVAAATVWADLLVRRLIHLVGADEADLQQAEQQLTTARADLDRQQEALTDCLAKHPVEALAFHLASARTALEAHYGRATALDWLAEDLHSTDNVLSTLKGEQPLPPGFAQRLAVLQWQSAGNPEPAPGEHVPPSAALDGTVAGGRKLLQHLETMLQTRRDALESEIAHWSRDVGIVSADLESARIELARLTKQRDLAKNAWENLSAEFETTRARFARAQSFTRIIPPAGPPEKPIRPRPLRYAILAGVLALAGSVFVIALASGKR